MARLRGIIPGEGLDLPLAASAPLLRQESQGPMPRVCNTTIADVRLDPINKSTGDEAWATFFYAKVTLTSELCSPSHLACQHSYEVHLQQLVRPCTQTSLSKLHTQVIGYEHSLQSLMRAKTLHQRSPLESAGSSRQDGADTRYCRMLLSISQDHPRHKTGNSRSNFLCDMAAQLLPCRLQSQVCW